MAMPDLSAIIQNSTATAWLYIPVAVVLGALHALDPGHRGAGLAARRFRRGRPYDRRLGPGHRGLCLRPQPDRRGRRTVAHAHFGHPGRIARDPDVLPAAPRRSPPPRWARPQPWAR